MERWLVLVLTLASAVAHAGGPLDADRGWLAGTVQDQLDRDGRLIPFGKGALFVPSMTHGFDEPPVTVWSGGELVEEATTGARIVLKPGTYRVQLGSGTVDQRLETEVSVREFHTTVVPAFWAGLSVHVVDPSFNSLRGAYELIRADGREYIGIGFGTNEQAGEPVATWVLRPGLYKIVRVGESYRARTDFTTVRLSEGHLTHFLLVQDPETGDFEGAGEVSIEELFALGGGLGTNLVLGGDLIFGSRRSPINGNEGESFSFRAFVDGNVNYRIDEHLFTSRLQIEEGQSKIPDEPIQKTNDRARIDLLYTYHLLPWIGPYGRLNAESNLLPEREIFDSPTVVATVDGVPRSPAEELDVSPSFGKNSFEEGIGFNIRFLKTVSVESSMRLGMGARQLVAHDLLKKNSGVVYESVPSTNQIGFDVALLATARLTRWVLINVEATSLVPFDEPNRAIVDIESNVALKLTRFLSINYKVRFQRDPFVSEREPIEQDLLLRFAWEVL